MCGTGGDLVARMVGNVKGVRVGAQLSAACSAGSGGLHCRRSGLVLSHSQHKVFVSAGKLSPREPDRGGDNDQKAQIESCSQSGCHNQPDCNCQCVKDWNFKDLGFFINSKYAASHE